MGMPEIRPGLSRILDDLSGHVNVRISDPVYSSIGYVWYLRAKLEGSDLVVSINGLRYAGEAQLRYFKVHTSLYLMSDRADVEHFQVRDGILHCSGSADSEYFPTKTFRLHKPALTCRVSAEVRTGNT